MYKNQLLTDWKSNPTEVIPPTPIEKAKSEVYGFKKYLDQYIDDFVTVSGQTKRGFAILDNQFWKVYDKNQYKTFKVYRSEYGHFYLV